MPTKEHLKELITTLKKAVACYSNTSAYHEMNAFESFQNNPRNLPINANPYRTPAEELYVQDDRMSHFLTLHITHCLE